MLALRRRWAGLSILNKAIVLSCTFVIPILLVVGLLLNDFYAYRKESDRILSEYVLCTDYMDAVENEMSLLGEMTFAAPGSVELEDYADAVQNTSLVWERLRTTASAGGRDGEVLRQVISEDTSAYMREAMEQVVAAGTGKNAYVTGYRIGGKTATSEIEKERDETGKITDTEDRYTASFIGVAPMDDPQIAVLVSINDLPESAPHGGGAIAAPVVGRIMEDVLPYIGVTASYDEDESDRREQTVPNVIGMTRDAADEALTNSGFEYIIHGEGETVTDQVPSSGIRIPASGRVILYMGEEKPTEQIEVPDVSGMDPDTCRDTLEEYGLYLKQRGVATSQITGDTTASSQSPAAGTKVSIGSVITVEFSDTTTVNDR